MLARWFSDDTLVVGYPPFVRDLAAWPTVRYASRPMRQLLLLTTHAINDALLERFDAIRVPPGFDKRLFVHRAGLWPLPGALRRQAAGRPLEAFTLWEARRRGYRTLVKRILPGSNHLPVIARMRRPDAGKYGAVWVAEYDVVYRGDWREVLTAVDDAVDFCTLHVQSRRENPDWPWWERGLFAPAGHALPEQLLSSFNPLYRLSRRALNLLNTALRQGWRGHHEMLMPTLLNSLGAHIEELGGYGQWTPAARRGQFYSGRQTFRWRPAIAPAEMNASGVLYHPVKLQEEPHKKLTAEPRRAA